MFIVDENNILINTKLQLVPQAYFRKYFDGILIIN
jgi:hypothetical protein